MEERTRSIPSRIVTDFHSSLATLVGEKLCFPMQRKIRNRVKEWVVTFVKGGKGGFLYGIPYGLQTN